MQFRIPVSESYAAMLGRATYNFAYLEWGMVCIGEALTPGFTARARKLTSGDLAIRLTQVADRAAWSDAEIEHDAKALIKRFAELTGRRNALFHSHPFTAPDGEQRLLYAGRQGREEWTLQQVTDVAAAFDEAAVLVSNLLDSKGLLSGFVRTREE